MNEEERLAIRESLREARRNLSEAEQSAAANQLIESIANEDFFKKAKHVAFYLTIDGEISPAPLLQHALKSGKSCYLPVISQDNEELLTFSPYDEGTELVENDWGISEPPHPEEDVSPTNFDIVFVPLVGFDANCFRLGMGKGFYDRTFSFKIFNRSSQPLLVGLAHGCQLTEPFPTQTWDVRLDAVVTPEKIYRPDTA